MGRQRRTHAPGSIFHLVSRTHRREPLFVPDLRGEVAELIQRLVGRTDAQLLAYVVMPNHLHVLLRQGRAPLSAVMQPLVRRIALRVQRRHGFAGSVVERRFRDRLCASADHVREAILYVHLNPWRAGLCDDACDYPWMSREAYGSAGDPLAFGIDPHVQSQLLAMFATADGQTREDLCLSYLRWEQWRMETDRARASQTAAVRLDRPNPVPPPPTARGAEDSWRRHFSPAMNHEFQGGPLLPDLRDYVDAQLPRLAPGCTSEDLRGSYLSHRRSRSRARLIRSAATFGYRTGALAAFFGISAATVSVAKYAPADEVG